MTSDEAKPLLRRKLGNTGIEVTELGLGTWGLCAESYGQVYPEQRVRTLERAIDQGIRLFDMAPVWGFEGASEREVANAVRGQRDDFVYVTRAGQVSSEHGVEAQFSAVSLRAQCEQSLARLATDHIDVWLLHEPREDAIRSAEVRDTAEALLREKKIRAWGASVSSVEAARAAIECGAQVLSLPFHLLRPELLWDLTTELSARGVGVLARSVLFHGLLAGRWTARKRFMPQDHRHYRWNPEALGARVAQVSELRFLVHGPMLSMASAAERFVLAHEVVSSAVIGPRTPGQVEASVHALAGGPPYLSEVDLERVKALRRSQR